MSPSLRLTIVSMLHSLIDCVMLVGVTVQALWLSTWLSNSAYPAYSETMVVYTLLAGVSVTITLSFLAQIGMSLGRWEVRLEERVGRDRLSFSKVQAKRPHGKAQPARRRFA